MVQYIKFNKKKAADIKRADRFITIRIKITTINQFSGHPRFSKNGGSVSL
jgi:hypothetical protein